MHSSDQQHATPSAGWTPPAEPGHTRRNLFVGLSTLSAVVLAFGYHTSLDAQAAGAATTSVAASGTNGSAGSLSGSPASGSSGTSKSGTSGTSGSASSGSSSSSASGTSKQSTTLKDGTYTGTSVNTRWGAVQVKITVSGGKITSSQAIDYPNENGHDQQINSYAVPKYNAEAVSAQSASIDAISGATVTWQGYTGSLQSALDQAGA